MTTPPGSFAIAVVVDKGGHWCVDEAADTVIPAIINSGAKYVRVAPDVANKGIDSSVSPYFVQMQNAGIQLGCVIYPQYGATLQTLLSDAQAMKNIGYFSWIHVDDALGNPPAGFAMQDLFSGLKTQGWTMILSHDSKWQSDSTGNQPLTGIWMHDHSFYLLSNKDTTPDLTGPAILQPDIDYINYIHEIDSNAIVGLDLEIPQEMSRFATLPVDTISMLLTEWAQAQSQYGFRFEFPLFWPAKDTSGYTGYDCLKLGNYALETNLIKGTVVEEPSNINLITTRLGLGSNPFIKSTVISYQLPAKSEVSLTIYDITGRVVRILAEGEKPVGSYEVNLSSEGLTTGIYFVRLETGNYKETKKLVLMK